MRTRERGIGNMAFIAVIVLLVIAIAMVFVKQSDADKFQGWWQQEKAKADKAAEIQDNAGKAYDAWLDVTGLGINELRRSGDAGQVYPTAAVIQEQARTWIMNQVDDIKQRSQAKLKNRQYQVDKTNNNVKVVETGDTTTVTLFGTAFVKETITFAALVAPLGEQFRFAAAAMEANNTLFEDEYKSYQTRVAQQTTRNTEAANQHQADITNKAQLFDTEKTRAAQMQDQNNQHVAKIDDLQSQLQAVKNTYEKDTRTRERELQSWKDRVAAEKKKMEIAMKEDPADGEVLVADARQGLVFINRGRNFRVAPDMKFKVWRIGKGQVREDVADIEAIEVGETKATCRVIKLLDRRVPVAPGMSFSSPFYDPHKKLRVHIFGNLRQYPSDLAKRRLAESGCTVSERLDDTVNVVILGEPPVDIDMAAASPEEAAANQERAKAERAARIREVMDTARTLGAIVVTEDVLQTFIEY